MGEADLKELLKERASKWGWKKSIDELLDYWFKAEHKIDQELLKIVKQLKQQKIVCAVVTNQEKYRAEYIINKMGFGGLFDFVFPSSSVGFKKPQPEFFQHVLSKVDCNGGEVVYFDDSPGFLEGARSLGIHAYLYKNPQQLKQVLAEFNLL